MSALRFSSAFPALRFSCRLQPFDHPLFSSILSQASSRHPPSSPPNVPPCLKHYQSAPKDEKDNDDNNEITIQSIANRAPPFTHSFHTFIIPSLQQKPPVMTKPRERERPSIAPLPLITTLILLTSCPTSLLPTFSPSLLPTSSSASTGAAATAAGDCCRCRTSSPSSFASGTLAWSSCTPRPPCCR